MTVILRKVMVLISNSRLFIYRGNIGFKAGIIFEKLGETGLITIAELARRLNFAADETALAAGWLARENKIYIERRNGLLYIRKE